MHNSKPFSSTILIDLKAGIHSGIQNTYVRWQDWLELTDRMRDLRVEEAVRKWHLKDSRDL